MTLVLSVHSRKSFWLVADRRLSYGDGRTPVDDAMKIMNLETVDGVGLLAYAGLGATARSTQPSDWMSAVLRGRANLTFEQALGVLADAASRELPRHLRALPGGSHVIVVPAFLRSVGARLYTIDNAFNRSTGEHVARFTRHETRAEQGARSPRIALAGTGGMYLARTRTPWARRLLSLVSAHDRGKATDDAVAQELARLNQQVHEKVATTVGPRCIVVWCRRPMGPRTCQAARTSASPGRTGRRTRPASRPWPTAWTSPP